MSTACMDLYNTKKTAGASVMPYIFAFLVAANAVFMGYHLLKEKEPDLMPAIHLQQQQQQFPVELEVVH